MDYEIVSSEFEIRKVIKSKSDTFVKFCYVYTPPPPLPISQSLLQIDSTSQERCFIE